MSRITIIPGGGMSTQGTEVYVDGLKLEGVTGITLVAKLNDVWRCTIEMAVAPEDLELGADVTVVCNPPSQEGSGGGKTS